MVMVSCVADWSTVMISCDALADVVDAFALAYVAIAFNASVLIPAAGVAFEELVTFVACEVFVAAAPSILLPLIDPPVVEDESLAGNVLLAEPLT